MQAAWVSYVSWLIMHNAFLYFDWSEIFLKMGTVFFSESLIESASLYGFKIHHHSPFTLFSFVLLCFAYLFLSFLNLLFFFHFSLLYLFLLSAVDLKSSAILSLVELIYFSVTWQKRSLSDKFLEALCRTNYTNIKQKISYHIIFRQIPLFLSLCFHVKQFHLLEVFSHCISLLTPGAGEIFLCTSFSSFQVPVQRDLAVT